MSSRNRNKERSGGAVYIEKLEKFESLLERDDERSKELAESSHASHSSSKKSSSVSRRVSPQKIDVEISFGSKPSDDLLEREERSLMKTKGIIERSLIKEAEKKEKRLARNLAEVEESKKFLDCVDRNLKMNDETNFNNTRRQFEDWNIQVHGKIQMNIAKQLDAISSKDLNKMKNEDYEKFLDISNRKPAIFRDIIIESEYDPLEPNRRAIKARTGILKDPILMLGRKHADEAAMLGESTGKKSIVMTGTKVTLPVELWASGKIEGTPHGRFMKMMNAKPKLTDTMTSNLVFDDYSYARGKAAVDAEMPKGKRAYPTNIGWDKTTF